MEPIELYIYWVRCLFFVELHMYICNHVSKSKPMGTSGCSSEVEGTKVVGVGIGLSIGEFESGVDRISEGEATTTSIDSGVGTESAGPPLPSWRGGTFSEWCQIKRLYHMSGCIYSLYIYKNVSDTKFKCICTQFPAYIYIDRSLYYIVSTVVL